MKRHPSLKDLSRDHHHALVLARNATRAADALDEELRVMWDTVLSDFELDLQPHFEVEERLLLPALQDTRAASLAERTLAEHRQLRAFLTGDQTRSRLRSFGSLLRDHVRFEENELFPAAEQLLDQGTLEAVAAASSELDSARRRKH